MDAEQDDGKSDLMKAVSIALEKQKLVKVSKEQFNQLKCIVERKNSLTQAPTGSGKTWAAISAPGILDILREQFNHTNIPSETRVLYIVPLIAIIASLELELSKYGVSYEVLNSDHTGSIDPNSKVIIVTPEKLMSRCTMSDICQLTWSALVMV